VRQPARAFAAAIAVLGLGGQQSGVTAGEALTTNQPVDTLSFVDLATMKSVAELKIGGKPAGIALSPDRTKAYVTAPDSKELVEVDAVSRAITRRLTLGGGPLGIAAHPTRAEVYVADWYTHEVLVVDTASFTVTAKIPVGQSPSGLAVTPDGKLLLSADRESDAVSIVDIASRKRIASVAVGLRPFGITIDADGRRAYTANVKSDDVTVIDIAGRKAIGRVPTGRRPYAVALTHDRGFATNQYGGSVTAFDLATLQPIQTVKACDHPEGIEADRTEENVYVACWGDDVLLRVDPATLRIVSKAKVGDGPRAFGKFLR
jgi:YVTN family beta-propeller protein